jgi:hypothetical protein
MVSMGHILDHILTSTFFLKHISLMSMVCMGHIKGHIRGVDVENDDR